MPYLAASRSVGGALGSLGASGSSSNLRHMHRHLVAVLEGLQRRFEAPLADVAPRTHDVGPDFHRNGITQVKHPFMATLTPVL